MKIIYKKDTSLNDTFNHVSVGELFFDAETNNLHLRTNNDFIGSYNTFNFKTNKPDLFFSYSAVIHTEGELHIKENSL